MGQTALRDKVPHRFIDLSGEVSRQSVVDGEPGQYFAHPTTVVLEDGRTIIAVYPIAKGHSL